MMKFYGRNNCKIPLDLVIGKNEKIVLQILYKFHHFFFCCLPRYKSKE